jgi:hypothetical protein
LSRRWKTRRVAARSSLSTGRGRVQYRVFLDRLAARSGKNKSILSSTLSAARQALVSEYGLAFGTAYIHTGRLALARDHLVEQLQLHWSFWPSELLRSEQAVDSGLHLRIIGKLRVLREMSPAKQLLADRTRAQITSRSRNRCVFNPISPSGILASADVHFTTP